MGTVLKSVVRGFCPPYLWSLGKRILARRAPVAAAPHDAEWTYVPDGWKAGLRATAIRGWNAEGVAESLLRMWPAFLEMAGGTAPLSLSNEAVRTGRPDAGYHNTVMTFGYVLGLAGAGRTNVSMLDWGGSLGHYSLLARRLHPEMDLEYVCMDMPALAAAGRRVQPGVRFVSDEAECLDRGYDLVLASGSLHYVEDWQALLAKLSRVATRHLFVTRVPVVQESASFVVLQRPYRYGYGTEYLGWCLNREEFLASARRLGVRLVREFLVDERIAIPGAPESAVYRGFLFDKGNE